MYHLETRSQWFLPAINIDLIKFDNEDTLMYLKTMMSYRYLPYITLPPPPRLTDFSATCIDYIFVKFSTNNLFLGTDLLSGMIYCDITDHLPYFISMKGNTHMNMNNCPKIRLFGEKLQQIYRNDAINWFGFVIPTWDRLVYCLYIDSEKNSWNVISSSSRVYFTNKG